MSRGESATGAADNEALSVRQQPFREKASGGGQVWAKLRGVVASSFLFGTLLGFNGLQMLSLVLLPFSRRTFRAFNRWAANLWWGWCVIGSERYAGMTPRFTGDDVPPRENALVIANHQQMTDIVALMTLAWRKDRLGDLKWFVKDPVKYVPGVGWGMLFIDCVFLKRNWNADRNKIETTFSKFNRDRIPVWLVSFPEGTRLTGPKLSRSRSYAREKGYPIPAHTLVPRTKGFVASVIGLRDHIQAVYDVTIGYEEGLPSLWQLCCGQMPRVHIDVRRYEISALPADGDALANWVRDRFEEKDRVMARFTQTARLAD